MKTITRVLSAPALAVLVMGTISCASKTSTPTRGFLHDYRGFTKESGFNDRLIYRGDVRRVAGYHSVYLEQVEVLTPTEMAKKGVTTSDLLRLQQEFRSALQEEVFESRYQLAAGRGPGVLSLRAAIVDLQPGDPAMFAASAAPYVSTATFVAGAATGAKFGKGSAKVEAEVLDSMTRERFAAVIDEKVGSKLEIVQGMSRWGHIELAMERWADRFGKFLENPAAKAN